MRHIALKVRNAAQSKRFYQDILGMDVVWEPDPQNVYLSSGCDNIAIHQMPENFLENAQKTHLDHLGFVVESLERVKELEAEFRSHGVRIVHPFKLHRLSTAPIPTVSSFNCFTSRRSARKKSAEPCIDGCKKAASAMQIANITFFSASIEAQISMANRKL